MRSPQKRKQLPIHVDKWIITIREGKDLTRCDNQRDTFFSKMNPVCELSMDGQGPFSTSVKPNTCQPCWDDSIEFEATERRQQVSPYSSSLLLTPSRLPPPKGSEARAGPGSSKEGDGDGDGDGDDPLPPRPGPKLYLVCYNKSPTKHNGDAPSSDSALPEKRESGEGKLGMSEIGRGQVTLTLAAGANMRNKVRIPLMRRNALGAQVPAGSVVLDALLVPGIPRPPTKKVSIEAPLDNDSADNIPEATAVAREGAGSHRVEELQMKPYTKPSWQLHALVALVGALMAVVLSVRFGALQGGGTAVMPKLSPIPVPLRVAVGKHKGSTTHHIRLHEDGNIVVALGPKPPQKSVWGWTGGVADAAAAAAAATATAPAAVTLWQSGPFISSGLGKKKGKGRTWGDDSGGVIIGSKTNGDKTCKDGKCQVRVGKDGKVALVRGKEELAVFSLRQAEAFFEVSTHGERG